MSEKAEQEKRLLAAWRCPSGWRYWSEVNNTEVGVWYTATAFGFMLFGGVLALLMRLQLASPNGTVMTADQYNQVFTLHGSVMMFLFAIPIFEALAVILLPQMLGARDLPFPRLSAFGYWCYLIGGLFLCGSLFFGSAPRGGWFMYPPLTSAFQPGIGADIWLLGFSFIEIAAIAAAVEMIVGVLKCRPPGMRVNLIPLYCWYVLVAAVMVLFAFPPLIAGSLLLELERAFQWPFFDATRGGDPLLWQHLFWLFGHPEVYIIFLPSVALVAMIVPTFARRPIVGYTWIVLSAIGVGFLSFGLWVHHMYTTGLPGVTLGLFSAASAAVAIPTGIQLFCFIATLAAGRVARSLPMLYVYGGMAIFVLGGLTGVMLALAPFDFQAHDTFFVVGHLHYVLIGGALFPIVGGLYYYFPVVSGRLLSERLGRAAFWLMFAGFNAAFLPMHFSGLLGMPRRVYTYPAGLGLESFNMLSTVGAFVLAAGLALVLWDVVRPKKGTPLAARNPWGAGTLEWLQEMPGKPWGVRSIPRIESRYPLWEQKDFARDVDEGRFYLPDADESRRETIVTTPVDARPTQCLQLPGPSFVALWAAVALGGFFVLGTYHLWVPALLSLAAATGVIWYWLWTGTAVAPEREQKDVGLGLELPLYVSGPASVGWWAMLIAMLADMAAYLSIVFGYFFFWTVREDFPPPGAGPEPFWPAAAAAAAAGAWGLTALARRLNRSDKPGLFHAANAGAAALALASAAALIAAPRAAALDPAAHVYGATVWTLAFWSAAHLALGALMHAYLAARRAAGRMTAVFELDASNVELYWHFAGASAVATAAIVGGFPLAR